MLRCEGLTQTYLSGGRPLTVLKNISFSLEDGGFLAIVGPSGSGKTTLLGLLAGLDRPDRGHGLARRRGSRRPDEDARARLRAEKVGFVFQSFHLIPTLTARENVQVPLELRGTAGARSARAPSCSTRVGLGDRDGPLPGAALGRRAAAGGAGPRLRHPAARSCSPTSRPAISTAAPATPSSTCCSSSIAKPGTTLVLVTHDIELARLARRTIRLADGTIIEDQAA